MLKERNTRDHRWYQKVQHAKLAKRDYNRTWIYPSGLRRIDEAFMKHQGYSVSGHVPKTMADFKNGVYVVDGIQTTFSAAFQHTATSNATMTGGYGPELVTNGSFEAGDTGWYASGEDSTHYITFENGSARYVSPTTSPVLQLTQSSILTVGKTYEITIKCSDHRGGGLKIDSAPTIVFAGDNGVFKKTFVAISSNLTIYRNSADVDVTIDNISVREVPKIQWRPHNLLAHSEDFADSDWGKGRSSIESNTAISPDGLQTADTIIEDTQTGAHYTVQTEVCEPLVTYTVSGFVKDKDTGFAHVGLQQNTSGDVYIGNSFVHVNLTTGAQSNTQNGGTPPTDVSYDIEDLGDGWYMVSVTGTTTATAGKIQTFIGPSTGSTNSYTGDGTSGIYIWGGHAYRNDLGGMADVPASERVLPALTKYVRTAGRVIGEDLVTNGDFSDYADELVSDGTFDVRGDETVTNGDFSLGSVDWIEGTNATIANGKLTYAGGSGNTYSYQSLGGGTVPSGAVLEFKFTVSGRTQGAIGMRIGGGLTSTVNADGNYTLYATSPASGIIYIDPSSDFVGSIDNISVREVLEDWSSGNDAVLSLSSGRLRVTNNVTDFGYASYEATVEVGKTYEVNLDFWATGTGTARWRLGSTAGNNDYHQSGTSTGDASGDAVFTATTTSCFISVYSNSTGDTDYVEYDNISVKEAVPGWSAENTTAIYVNDSDQLVVDDTAAAGTDSRAVQLIDTVIGNVYKLSFDKISTTSAFWFAIGDAGAFNRVYYSGTLGTTTGKHEYTFVAQHAATLISMITSAAGVTVYDNIKVEEVDVDPSSARYMARIGHHIFNGQQWVNEGLELESEARTNLITDGVELASPWVAQNATRTANSTTSPAGVVDAIELVENTATSTHQTILVNLSVTSGQAYTFSVYAKQGTGSRYLWLGHGGNGFSAELAANFDLTTGTINGTNGALDGSTIEDVGGGWYRCSVTSTSTATVSNAGFFIRIADTTGTGYPLYTGDGSSSIYFWGAQLEAGSTPSSLIPTSGSSVTRAAETLVQTGDKAPWPTAVYVTNEELVTNGTFDTDTSGWTEQDVNATFTVTNGQLTIARGATGSGYVSQTITTVSGSVYRATIDLIDDGPLDFRVGTTIAAGDITSTGAVTASGSYELIFVASGTTTHISGVNTTNSTSVTFDNISVKEINPRALSGVMDGRVTYADDNGLSVEWFRQHIDNNNRLRARLDTTGANTGYPIYQQTVGGTNVEVAGSTTAYSPGINVPFKIASRHLDNAVQGATDGTATTENTTPPGLPDLATTDLAVGYDYMGTIRTFRMFDQDIASTGLVSSTEPSLEPTLSLVFDGSGDSYISFDWSE